MHTVQELEDFLASLLVADGTRAAELVSMGVTADHFASTFNKRLFSFMEDAWVQGKPCDIIAAAQALGMDELPHLMQMQESAPLHLPRPLPEYGQALVDFWRLFKLQAELTDVSRRITSRDLLDPAAPVIETVVSAAFAQNASQSAAKCSPIAVAVDEALGQIEMALVDRKPICVPSGMEKLDRCIYGFQPGFVYVLGARPSVGKTTLALVWAVNAAESGAPVAFFTVEMAAADLATKIISRAGRINIGKLMTGDLSEDEQNRLMGAVGKVAAHNLHIADFSSPTIPALTLEAHRLVRAHGVKLIVVDYMQLFESGLEGKFRTSRDEVKYVSAQLKRLAKTLNVPVLVLSQLNRQTPEKGEPELVNLAESDGIARDADVIMMLYIDDRDEYKLAVKKNRRGAKGVLSLNAELHLNSFTTV